MPEICLNDESVNRYGFRVLTAGIDLSAFKKNPVLLFNHQRSETWNDHSRMPAGRWDGVRIDGNRLIAEPVLDAADPQGAALQAKLGGGFINAASIGIKVIEWSEDPKLILPGQTRPTVTKCELQEVSLVDIPANPNCVRLSYGTQTVELGAHANPDFNLIFHKKTPTKMDKETLKKLGLAEDATQEQIAEAVGNMMAQVDKMETLQSAQKEEQAKLLVEQALTAGKITKAQEQHFLKLAQADYENTKATLALMEAFKPISEQVAAGGQAAAGAAKDGKPELVKKYDDMATNGTLLAYSRQNGDEFKKMQDAKVAYERETLMAKGLYKLSV